MPSNTKLTAAQKLYVEAVYARKPKNEHAARTSIGMDLKKTRKGSSKTKKQVWQKAPHKYDYRGADTKSSLPKKQAMFEYYSKLAGVRGSVEIPVKPVRGGREVRELVTASEFVKFTKASDVKAAIGELHKLCLMEKPVMIRNTEKDQKEWREMCMQTGGLHKASKTLINDICDSYKPGDMVDADDIEINRNYIQELKEGDDARAVVAQDKKGSLGFVFYRLKKTGPGKAVAYVSLICAKKGQGPGLLSFVQEDVIKFASGRRGEKLKDVRIELDSVPNPLTVKFYLKMKFQFIPKGYMRTFNSNMITGNLADPRNLLAL